MKILAWCGALLLACTLATPAVAQQRAPDPGRRAELAAKRDSLEAELMARFLEQLFRELSLDEAARVETRRIVNDGAARRRDLLRTSSELRGRMYRALRTDAAADWEFVRLLAQHESLRDSEAAIWRREQEELARVLTPRQRTHFVMHWARFQEQVRDILMQQMRALRGEVRQQQQEETPDDTAPPAEPRA